MPSQPLVITRELLASLHPDPSNAREHGPENLLSIRASLRQFQQVEPLVVQRSSRKIVAGNGRYTVMLEEGWAEADCILLDLDDTQAAALGIALNRTAELAGWNNEVLGKLLAALPAAERAATGFTEDQAKELIAAWEERDTPAENVEALAEVRGTFEDPPEVVEAGDVWRLGDKHWLVVADAVKDATVWLPHFTAAMWCVPYGGPMVFVTEAVEEQALFLIQPELYIANHCLALYHQLFPDQEIRCVAPQDRRRSL